MRDKSDKFLNYIESHIKDEIPHLDKIAKSAFKDNRRFIQIGKLEGKILSLLIKMNNIKKIVEVGTLAGYSAIWMSIAMCNSGVVYTIEKCQEHAQIAKENFKDYPNINLVVGDAKQELQFLQKFAPFDMIFIDADKSGYLSYLDWADINIKKNGIIVADNTLLFGTVCDLASSNKRSWQAMTEFNQRISDCDKYESVILPTQEGLTIAIKKF